MENINISKSELKKIIKETFVDVLSNRKDLIGDAVLEVIEDIGLGRAIEEGKTGEYVDVKVFKKNLQKKLKASK
jgi:hypothetical protein